MATERMFVAGVNTYAGSPLAGCINDAQALVRIFERHGGWNAGLARVPVNDHVRNADLREGVEWVVDGQADRTVFSVSGHGSRRQRRTPGYADPTEEFFCPYDYFQLSTSPELLVDAWYEKTFERYRKGTKNHVFFFCCHSGGATNASVDDAAGVVMRSCKMGLGARPKYLASPDEELYAKERLTAKAFAPDGPNVFVDNEMNYTYFAAARSDQYSYEVTTNGGNPHDVSREGLEKAIEAKPNASVREIHRLTVEFIKDRYGYPQTPQLWGSSYLLDTDYFS